MPKVDVIIPAFNAARFLGAALDSVLAQSYEDWRIVLVDDGSTDGTAAMAWEYQSRLGDRMMYIRQANQGLPGARNTAIRSGSAELLALLDADDVWLPCRLLESVQVMDRHPEVGLSHGFIARIDEDGTVVDSFTRRNPHAEGSIAPYIYMRRIDLPCPTITFRRACVERVGHFDESLRATEDRDLWLRIAQHYRVAQIPMLLAHYRISPQAMTTDPERMLQAQLQFIEKHYGTPGCGRWARRIALSGIYRQRAEAFAIRRRRAAALASAFHALALSPFHLSNARTAGSLLLRGGVIG